MDRQSAGAVEHHLAQHARGVKGELARGRLPVLPGQVHLDPPLVAGGEWPGDWFLGEIRASHGESGEKSDRVYERGQNDLARDVEFDGPPGSGEVLHAPRGAALLDHAIDNQDCAIGDQPQIAEL